MAEYVEQDELPGDFDQINEQQQAEPQEETTQAVAPVEDDLPEKYRGKTAQEIARMHQEAEKLIGRQAQEVHEVRSLADQLLKQQLAKPVQAMQQPNDDLSEDEFFANPRSAVARTVEQHPAVLEAKQAALELKKMKTSQMLQTKHPDFTAVVADAGFQNWVKASPLRAQMFHKADQEYDFNSADELLSTYKELAAARNATVQTSTKQASDAALKAASVSTGGSGESSRKIYRRQDLIKLSMTDPDRYMAMQDEIMAAYNEGRVR